MQADDIGGAAKMHFTLPFFTEQRQYILLPHSVVAIFLWLFQSDGQGQLSIFSIVHLNAAEVVLDGKVKSRHSWVTALCMRQQVISVNFAN